MSYLNTPAGYGLLSKTLHWVMMLMLIIMMISGMTGMVFDYKAPHEVMGKTILVLAIARLVLRLIAPAPAPLNSHARWEVGLAHLIHWALYLVLFLYPLSGWMMVSAGSWGETGNLPFVPDTWGDALYNWHHAMKIVLTVLVTLHIAGALKHLIIDRDGTLSRMWFGGQGR